MAFVAESTMVVGAGGEAAAQPDARTLPKPVLRRVRLMISVLASVVVIDLMLYLPRLL